MAANRNLPFGYILRMGKICVNEQEARLVAEIFTACANGASYRQLTVWLNTQPIPYNEPDKAWNKNMIARILCNDVYVGTGIHPTIITGEQWVNANAAKPSTGKSLEENSDVKAIRQLARCARCGSRLKLGANSRSWERWKCPSCDALTTKAVTPRIKEGLYRLMAQLLDAPERVSVPERRQEQSAATEQQERLYAALDDPEFDEALAHKLAYTLAAARFDALGSEDYETMRIRELLANAEGGAGLDTALLRNIASAVLVHPDGTVGLRLKNGQIVEGR